MLTFFKLTQDKPLVNEMFRRCDLWAQEIRGYDKERYYTHVFLPTMRLLEYMHQLERSVQCKSSKKAINTMIQNSLRFFENVTNDIYNQ
jgi:hypothetical protein